MTKPNEADSEVYAARRAMGFDRPGDIAGKLFGKFLEVSRSDQQPVEITGFRESMRDRWIADGGDEADFDERWERFCEEAKADPTLGGQFPSMAEGPTSAESADEPHPVVRLIREAVDETEVA